MKDSKLPKLSTEASLLPQKHTTKVWQQFQRDLSKIGTSSNEEVLTVISVNELLTKIFSSVKHLVEKQEESFWQLLYVVDLPEVILSNIDFSEEGLKECARIILIREWQKVILRQHFSAS